jgi:lysophospholipase L1-like esterase
VRSHRPPARPPSTPARSPYWLAHPRALAWLGLAAAWVATAGPAPAQLQIVAFGDSITFGAGDDPTRVERGYPPRLEALLAAAGVDVEVENHGLGGEDTVEGLTRIDQVLAASPSADLLLLMEGTNDIAKGIGLETTRFDLAQMALKAEARGMSVVHATLIPRLPNAKYDPLNVVNQQIVQNVRDLAGSFGRDLADPFEVFGGLSDLYSRYYSPAPDDPVGHPNADGYDVLARVFFEVLRQVDTVPPVTGLLVPEHGADGVPATTPIEVDLWDFGSGIDLLSATLLVNDQPTGAIATGTPREAHFSYQPPTPLSGIVRVKVRARDRAPTTPNQLDREVARFTIAGTALLTGDIDRSGRVDGHDLVELARRFGSRRNQIGYLAAADLNGDGAIDGSDLALLAANFGRSA